MSDEEPKSKKAKVDDEDHKEDKDDEKDEDKEEKEADEKKDKKESNGGEDGVFDLSSTRRLTVRKFKGNTLIDIREYYDKKGKKLPGKKGISLNVEQFNALKDLVLKGDIDKVIDKLEK